MARRSGPAFRAAPLRVRVPATSANLGPGFDALGLALSLYDDVVVRVTDEPGLSVDVAGEGAETVARNARHLVVKSMRATFRVLGGEPTGLEVVCANRIPHGRGLGSSAAAIVSGIVAARGLVVGGSERMDDAAALELAASLEGHPDNVAACLLGGLTIAWCEAAPRDAAPREAAPREAAPREAGQPEPGQSGTARARAVVVPVSTAVCPVAFIPGSSSSTKAARRLLPESVPHEDAALNSGRSALLVEALRSRPDLLLAATEDRLHQSYRSSAMPRSAALLGELRAAGVPAVVSGAGPTVLALCTEGEREQVVTFATRGWTAQALDVDREGAQVLPL